MASKESKYSFSIKVSLQEEDKKEEPMMVVDTVWNGLSYDAVVGMEKLLMQAMAEITSWGEKQAASVK